MQVDYINTIERLAKSQFLRSGDIKRYLQREKARDALEKARTEASAIEAWRAVLKAEAMDDEIPGLGEAKLEIGRQLQVVIEQEVLPEP